MIKVTVNSFAGNEFVNPKPVFIWFGFNQTDKENVGVILTFHNSALEAEENTVVKSDKALQAMVGIQDQLTLKITDIPPFTDFETLKTNIQAKLVEGLSALNLPHIDSFQIV